MLGNYALLTAANVPEKIDGIAFCGVVSAGLRQARDGAHGVRAVARALRRVGNERIAEELDFYACEILSAAEYVDRGHGALVSHEVLEADRRSTDLFMGVLSLVSRAPASGIEREAAKPGAKRRGSSRRPKSPAPRSGETLNNSGEGDPA